CQRIQTGQFVEPRAHARISVGWRILRMVSFPCMNQNLGSVAFNLIGQMGRLLNSALFFSFGWWVFRAYSPPIGLIRHEGEAQSPQSTDQAAINWFTRVIAIRI